MSALNYEIKRFFRAQCESCCSLVGGWLPAKKSFHFIVQYRVLSPRWTLDRSLGLPDVITRPTLGHYSFALTSCRPPHLLIPGIVSTCHPVLAPAHIVTPPHTGARKWKNLIFIYCYKQQQMNIKQGEFSDYSMGSECRVKWGFSVLTINS